MSDNTRLSPDRDALALLTGQIDLTQIDAKRGAALGRANGPQVWNKYCDSMHATLIRAGQDKMAAKILALRVETSSGTRGKSAPQIGDTTSISIQQSRKPTGEVLGDPWCRVNVGPYFAADDKGKSLVVKYEKGSITITW